MGVFFNKTKINPNPLHWDYQTILHQFPKELRVVLLFIASSSSLLHNNSL